MTRVEPVYFPPLTFGDDVERDDFIQQWFGKHLWSMDEPRLYLERGDVIRLLTLPTFHAPCLIRFDRSSTATLITAKQSDGRGGFGQGRLTTYATTNAPLSIFDDTIQTLQAMDFWSQPAFQDADGKDGTRYVIESRLEDEYHVIQRASPNRRERDLLNWINSQAQGLLPKG